jgi:hypothetical protein
MESQDNRLDLVHDNKHWRLEDIQRELDIMFDYHDYQQEHDAIEINRIYLECYYA